MTTATANARILVFELPGTPTKIKRESLSSQRVGDLNPEALKNHSFNMLLKFQDKMMIVKTSITFKKRLITAVTMLGIALIFNFALAESTNQEQPVGNQPNSEIISVAQNETQNATNDENSTSSEKEAAESSSDEKKESGGAKKRPLKDFRPSEQIEAEQAVDFPYDI